jgi:hypothetical protein
MFTNIGIVLEGNGFNKRAYFPCKYVYQLAESDRKGLYEKSNKGNLDIFEEMILPRLNAIVTLVCDSKEIRLNNCNLDENGLLVDVESMFYERLDAIINFIEISLDPLYKMAFYVAYYPYTNMQKHRLCYGLLGTSFNETEIKYQTDNYDYICKKNHQGRIVTLTSMRNIVKELYKKELKLVMIHFIVEWTTCNNDNYQLTKKLKTSLFENKLLTSIFNYI